MSSNHCVGCSGETSNFEATDVTDVTTSGRAAETLLCRELSTPHRTTKLDWASAQAGFLRIAQRDPNDIAALFEVFDSCDRPDAAVRAENDDA